MVPRPCYSRQTRGVLALKIGQNISRLRKDRDWSLDTLASRCVPRTSRQQIDRLEKGERPLTVAWIERIAAALDVDPAELVAGERGEFTLTSQAASVAARTVARIVLRGAEPDPGIVQVLAEVLIEMTETFAAHPATRSDPQAARIAFDFLARQFSSKV